jgi:hypothetical protein
VSPAGRLNVAKLFNETGHNSIDERNTEALRYIDELAAFTEAMQPNAKKFVEDMIQRRDNRTLSCSGKQLYWLRDLYQEFCC